MNSNGDTVYAVIIVCVVVFLSLLSCVVFQYLRKIKRNAQKQPSEQPPPPHEWQQLRSVVLHSTEPGEDPQPVQKWQSKYPPNTHAYIDVTKHPDVIDRGVLAWKFVETETTADAEEESNAAVMDEDPSNIVFCQGQGSIMTNLPVPMQEFSYYEVKILQLNEQDTLAIGFATKPYPRWRLPGWHRHSVAYHSNTGHVFASDRGRAYGPSFKQGDVIGVGYLYQSGTVFFTRNGHNLGKASIGFKYPLYPTLGSIGPCHVATNFGIQDFLFSAANSREAAYGPKQGSLLPPPAYGGHEDDTLFQEQQEGNNNLTYVDQPPSYS
ncbi:unnamed protein product [Mucor hiemalis]